MRTIALLLLLPFLASSLFADDVSFNRDIRPILSENCYFCHGFDENNREADLRLDVEEDALQAIEPGEPDDSELLLRILSDDEDEVMPPPSAHKTPITPEQIELIRQWITEGAQYEPHWAFVAPVRPELDSEEPLSGSAAIDHLAGKRAALHDLQRAKPASPAKWLRRMTLDLTGLPPTISELDAFVADVKDQGEPAFSDAVDRVLASAHFGERMAIDWLDVARYADTNGYQMDSYRMNWPWRDWVVQAFNDNMPFDQFTIEQLAGDLLDDPTEDQMIATAFNRNHMINAEGGAIPEENLAKNVFDRVETTTTTWLGLTLNCCQCHDHKFDPLRQSDYYSFYAMFNQMSERGGVDKRFGEKPDGDTYDRMFMLESPYISLATKEQNEQLAELTKAKGQAVDELEAKRKEFDPPFIKWVEEMREDPELVADRIDNARIRAFVISAQLDKPYEGNRKALLEYFMMQRDDWRDLAIAVRKASTTEDNAQMQIPLVMVMRDDKPRETHVLERGSYETPGDKVDASVPDFLPPLALDAKADRLALARWLVAPEHPLTSRVTVNRYWQMLFGNGLVKTPDNFGLQGALPSHPELLDWLAVDFRENGWDVKSLMKTMVLTQTYRQSAEVDADNFVQDPDNQWLCRGPRHRLDSRLLRDQALSLSGLLVDERGGPAVAPYQPGGIWEEMSLGNNQYTRDSGSKLYRRSLYTVWRRIVAPANFFDVPSRQSCSVKPHRTNTPLHALTLLNDTTYTEAARVWADRLSEIPEIEARLERLFYAATARKPDPRELQSLQSTLEKARVHFAHHPDEAQSLVSVGEQENQSRLDPSEHAAWTSVCLLVLNLDETLSK